MSYLTNVTNEYSHIKRGDTSNKYLKFLKKNPSYSPQVID